MRARHADRTTRPTRERIQRGRDRVQEERQHLLQTCQALRTEMRAVRGREGRRTRRGERGDARRMAGNGLAWHTSQSQGVRPISPSQSNHRAVAQAEWWWSLEWVEEERTC